MNLRALKRALANLLDIDTSVSLQACQGGDTHYSFRLSTGPTPEVTLEAISKTTITYFVKVNSSSNAQVLQSEADSLRSMARLLPGAYPTPIAECITDDLSILVMSFHQLETISGNTAAELGGLLATQHSITSTECGWHSDNFIGSSAQGNDWMRSWPDFFLTRRLQPQLIMAIENGLATATVEEVQNLIASPPAALTGHQPRLSLLHGDLWSGNAGFDSANSRPMLFDPAPYFGDPEVDIAMTHLFGSFTSEFYASYQNTQPLQQGHQVRREVYNLYHLLNHFNLFGNIYQANIQENLRRIRQGEQYV